MKKERKSSEKDSASHGFTARYGFTARFLFLPLPGLACLLLLCFVFPYLCPQLILFIVYMGVVTLSILRPRRAESTDSNVIGPLGDR